MAIILLLVEEISVSLDTELGFNKKVKLKDIAVFCRQFYTMLDAGVQIDNCLTILAEQLTHPQLKKPLLRIAMMSSVEKRYPMRWPIITRSFLIY